MDLVLFFVGMACSYFDTKCKASGFNSFQKPEESYLLMLFLVVLLLACRKRNIFENMKFFRRDSCHAPWTTKFCPIFFLAKMD